MKPERPNQKKVKDGIAVTLALYARRRDEKGFAYSPDSYIRRNWNLLSFMRIRQDQLKATTDVKRDMEEMNRWTV